MPFDPTNAAQNTLPTFTVNGAADTGLGSLAGLGMDAVSGLSGANLFFQGMGLIGNSIFSANGGWGSGLPQLANPGSYAQAIQNGAQWNPPQTMAGVPQGVQQVSQDAYNSLINAGFSENDATVALQNSGIGSNLSGSQLAQAVGDPLQGQGLGAADFSATNGLGTTAGTTTLPQMTVYGNLPGSAANSLPGLATLGGMGAGGAGAAIASSGGSGTFSTPGTGSSPSQANQYGSGQNTASNFGTSSSLSPDSSVTAGGTGALDAATSSPNSAVGSVFKTALQAAPLVGAIGSIATGLSGGTSGTNTSAPNPSTTAGNILGAELQYAPQILQMTQQNAPAYNTLQNQLLSSSANNVAGLYGSLTPQLQSAQTAANLQQAQGNQSLLANQGAGYVNAYQSANPQLQALQSQYTNLAASNPSPVGQITGAGQWGQGYNQQVSNTLQANQVQAPMAQSTAGMLSGYTPNVSMVSPQSQVQAQGVQAQNIGAAQVQAQGNSTLNQLNQTAQQQLALGTSVSPQEAATVANQVLSNYNSMGRANDPTAIAGLATGLDTYGQQLLQQREGAASTASGLTTNQGQLNLAGQQSNQQANLAASQSNQGAGLQAQAYNQNAGLAAQQANLSASQQSQLANQQALLSGSGLGLQALTSQAGLGQSANLANQQASLTAQQANLSGALGGLGLQYQGLYGSAQQGLQAQTANQQAQLANANYQQSLLQGASQLAYNTAAPAYSSLLGQSGALTNAYNTVGQGGTSQTGANALSGMYNPFNTSAYTSAYNAQANASQTNATTNAGYISGGLGLLGSVTNAAGNAGGFSNLFGNLFG